MEERSFFGCDKLQDVDFNGTRITKIPNNCFQSTSLKSIVLPSCITEIGTNSFSLCFELNSIFLLGVKKIGERAFSNCSNLRNIVLSDTIETIHENSFGDNIPIYNSNALIEITCPDRFETYFLKRFPNASFVRNGEGAFLNCEKN